MEFNLAFILGLLASTVALISLQLKDMRLVLVCQVICNGAGALSYILSGGFSGCGIYIIAVLQCLIFYIFRAKKIEAPTFMAYVFAVGYLICSAFTYKGLLDIISAIAALTCAFGMAQKNPSKYRLLMLLNGIIWLIYDIALPATITMALSHIITSASAVIGIVRLDILAKKDKILTEKKL